MDIPPQHPGRPRNRIVGALAGALIAGLASGQAGPGPAPGPSILPAEHPHARALLGAALRYVGPSNALVDPASGYPVEGWNQDPKRGLFLRSFTQLTAIGLYMEVLAHLAAGRVEAPGLPPEAALAQLARLVATLRADQRDPSLAAEGLLGNFLDLATGKRLGPLASSVDKSKFLGAFGPDRGESLWKALIAAGWLVPRKDGLEADIVRGEKYGYEHFDGPLAPFGDDAARRQALAILDARVVMLVFGDNANLTTSAAKVVGTLLDPALAGRAGVGAIRDELERFLEAQRPGYARLYDAAGGLFYFGWDATRDRLFGWDDLQGARTIGHMDYLVNEFRGPATFVAARFGIPADAVANLGFFMKPYRTLDGRDLYALAPWEGSAFQAFGLGLSLNEPSRPGWGPLMRNMVAIELDFAARKGLPGFLSESYTGEGTRYTGSVGIPEITVSPRPRVTDAASLYTLGVAYAIAPAPVEAFLKSNAPAIAGLVTDHGPWEGYNVTRKEPIPFQTTAHTLALALGLIGRGSADLDRYARSKGLAADLDAFFRPGPGADLLGGSASSFAWTPSKSATIRNDREGPAFRARGDSLDQFGIAFVAADPKGLDLSAGELTLRYRSTAAVDPITIEFKPAATAPGRIPRQIVARLAATSGGVEGELRVPLPATPGLARIKEVVIYHEGPTRGPVDLTLTRFAVTPPAP